MSRILKLNFLMLVLLCSACIKEPQLANYTPTIAIPIVNTNLSMYDLLARQDSNDLLVVDPTTKLLALNYTNDDLSFGLKDIYNPQSIDFSINVPFGSNQATTTPGGTVTKSGSINVPVGLPIDVFLASFSSITVNASAQSTFNHDISIAFSLPNFTKNQTAYSTTLNMPALGNASNQQDFSPSVLSFEEAGQSNTIAFNYTITITTNGGPINSNDAVNLDFDLNTIVIQSIDLNPGNIGVSIPEDTILLSLFRNAANANIDFQFTNPEIQINIANGLEIPFQFNFTELSVTDASTNDKSDLLLQSFPNPFNVAGKTGNQPASTNLVIDKDNSNIQDVITPNDKLIRFGMDVTANTNSGSRYTININDKIEIKLVAYIPLKGYLNEYLLSSNVSINLPADQEIIIDGGIRYHFENAFPAGISVEIFYEDENGNTTGQLTQDPIVLLEAPAVDGIGKITQPTITNGDINLTETEFNKLLSAKNIRIDARIATSGADTRTTVGIFLENRIDFKLGVKARVNTN